MAERRTPPLLPPRCKVPWPDLWAQREMGVEMELVELQGHGQTASVGFGELINLK